MKHVHSTNDHLTASPFFKLCANLYNFPLCRHLYVITDLFLCDCINITFKSLITLNNTENEYFKYFWKLIFADLIFLGLQLAET
jgi:hypothetical protein